MSLADKNWHGPVVLPGDVELRWGAPTGFGPWQLTSGIRLLYGTLDDALMDYVLHIHTPDMASKHGVTPRKYRSVYGRTFVPLMTNDHFVSFHDTLPEALAEIQAAEQFCEENSEHFLMQGTGIHRYKESARRYVMAYDADEASGLLAEVGRRVRAEGEVFDLFISHATEDKEALVRPLAESLRDLGLRVWYDEFELKAGDGLRASLDRGIATSRNGLVVLSPAFVDKRWTQWELDGIVGRAMDGQARIVPVWHDIGRAAVTAFSPSIANIIGISTANKDIGQLAHEIIKSLI